ncbi:threonine-phosphate decarboxylase CobD [Labrys monachus]|uniref:threonine-phosphate decarboxylase n=1 Tax=Labrys monachus TaxID=217067 RepID=A0ABU0FD21_9HYPH|nr:threonine-phosphate decarboxylase CobD [Labrys monachus]MDQ0392341.1 cobalamin biosynthetic protein CobC [Labrys monachus]
MSVMEHGGNLGEARRLFPRAPDLEAAMPWIDLSTGINPWPYPVPAIPPGAWTALPSPDAVRDLEDAAARCYGATSSSCVVATPGTQAAIQWLPHLFPAGTVAVLGPTYAEHLRSWRRAGHQVGETADIEALGAADIAVIVNPNNPDGRLADRDILLRLAAEKHKRGGALIVDESFAEVMPQISLADMAGTPGLVILRSFGKFFGLAGLRLGFVLAEPAFTGTLREAMGPWAVSGEALAIGQAALADILWQNGTRTYLRTARQALDACLAPVMTVAGGTDLYRLVETPNAPLVFQRLGTAGIWVRRFGAQPHWLRFGLPPNEEAYRRLQAALGDPAGPKGRPV